ncbi:hypothetical protein Y1Q_0010635 [Alligator mississippiensis]|uniref:Uncharacterized protein n=1 Tax=Alligator mississippiensis TaxID=8496 RepID=A0A151M6H3_ALLMI|nr:hypothetical protein Y1Q_0010635 [Alligator mississippiensis]
MWSSTAHLRTPLLDMTSLQSRPPAPAEETTWKLAPQQSNCCPQRLIQHSFESWRKKTSLEDGFSGVQRGTLILAQITAALPERISTRYILQPRWTKALPPFF